MLHSKLQDHRIFGSREVFTIYGHGSHIGHVTKTISINLCALSPMETSLEIWL